jgi:L-asparaginase II
MEERIVETLAGYSPLVELTRGGMVECVHFGTFAIVDAHGNLLASAGDPELRTFPRSSMKPFQAIPFVESGGPEHYDLTDEELAIICASHTGTDKHVAVLKQIHQKVGIQESDLQCGVHWPSDKTTAQEMRQRGEQPTPYRHNCSGKHSGMLAQAKLRGLPLETYLDPEHPIQQAIRQTMAEMGDLRPEDLTIGIDGCSAPVFALPVRAFALAVARLCDPAGLAPSRQAACRKITHAMISFPEMVAGPGRLDTILMHAMAGKAVAKGGAEGYQMIGLLPGALQPSSPGIGIAIKFSDGDPSRRATNTLITAILAALGFQQELSVETLREVTDPTLRNWRGLVVGEQRLSAATQQALKNLKVISS